MATPHLPPHERAAATVADWMARAEDDRFELIDGTLIQKAAPGVWHGIAQASTNAILHPYHRRIGSVGGPGGWWIGSEIDVLMDERGFRPDIVGWRRDRVPTLPEGRPVTVRPDWICEIVSDSNRTTDTVKKLRAYHQSGVPHYWIIDQLDRSLTVHRHSADGYLIELRATADERVHPAPFDLFAIHVALLLGEDVDE